MKLFKVTMWDNPEDGEDINQTVQLMVVKDKSEALERAERGGWDNCKAKEVKVVDRYRIYVIKEK